MSESGLKLVFEDDSGRVYWNNDAKSVELEVKGGATSAQYRAALELVLVVINDKRPRKFLADVGRVGKISGEDMVWTETDWSQRLAKTKVKFVAIVMPKSLAAHMTVDKISERVDAKIITRRFFPDVDSAREWLAKQ